MILDRVSILTPRPLHTVADLDALSAAVDAASVAAIEHPIERNELITHNYWLIAQRMYRLLGRENLVWPTFGAWASAQAGSYMRIGQATGVAALTLGYGRHVTDLLGVGNQLIFGHIGPVFETFVTWLDEDRAALGRGLREPRLRDVVAERLALDPRSHDEHPDGELLMVLAFEQYLRAVFEADPDAKAERIFVANCCMALEEQSRVDETLESLLRIPRLNAVLRLALAPVRVAGHRFAKVGALAVARSPLRHVARPGWTQYRRLLQRMVLDGNVSEVIGTQLFLEMKLGAENLNLSDDVEPTFAPGLETIDLQTADFSETWQRVLQWDPTPDSALGSAAVDWSELSDRMHFIIDLFRVNQHRADLAVHPMGSF